MTATNVELWDNQQKALIKEQIAPKATDGELRLFAQVCQRTALDPFSRQIFAIHRGGKMTIQTSIDGFRVIAERSREYEGQTPKQWCGRDGKWVDVWLSSESPAAARVGVYRRNFREPLYAVATWKEYAQTDSPMWKKMGPHMLAKCAESLALRAAFPADLSGLYTTDEFPTVAASDTERGGRPEPQGVDGAKRVEQPSSGARSGNEPSALPPHDPATGEILDVASTQAPAPKTFAPPQRSQSAANTDALMQRLEAPFKDVESDYVSVEVIKQAITDIAKLSDEQKAALQRAAADADIALPKTSRAHLTPAQYGTLVELIETAATSEQVAS